MTAEDILEKHDIVFRKDGLLRYENTKDEILAAMKEIAEIAAERAKGYQTDREYVPGESVQEIITSLFPKKEVFTIPSNTIEIRGLE